MDNWIPVTSGYPLSNTDSRVSSDVIATDGKDVYTASFVWNIDGTPKGWAKDDWVLGNEKITHWQPFPVLPSAPGTTSTPTLQEQLSAAVAREAKLREVLTRWQDSNPFTTSLSVLKILVEDTDAALSDTTPSVVPDSVAMPVKRSYWWEKLKVEDAPKYLRITQDWINRQDGFLNHIFKTEAGNLDMSHNGWTVKDEYVTAFDNKILSIMEPATEEEYNSYIATKEKEQ